ncbi:hypothetical protein SLI_7098 [Streptomyces lividans 1326]|uniref:Uncharacterized protein n=1 Tax=Streptomyces lividans 1326 TaxID=1200984 RepID=A0A7U9E1A0_STRLI|nr:hypothetical protein SLI_7098 [Streptomyces lividans 1326]
MPPVRVPVIVPSPHEKAASSCVPASGDPAPGCQSTTGRGYRATRH